MMHIYFLIFWIHKSQPPNLNLISSHFPISTTFVSLLLFQIEKVKKPNSFTFSSPSNVAVVVHKSFFFSPPKFQETALKLNSYKLLTFLDF